MSALENDQPRQPQPLPLTPHDWAEPWKGPWLEAFARIRVKATACRLVGISYENFKYARRTDPVFAEAVEEAAHVAVDLLRQTAWNVGLTAATTGRQRTRTTKRVKRTPSGEVLEDETTTVTEDVFSDTLLLANLRAYAPEYRNVVEHTGEGGGPVEFQVYRKPPRERVLAIARMMAELEPGVPSMIEGIVTNGHGHVVEEEEEL